MRHAIIVAAFVLVAAGDLRAESIWLEGEKPSSHSFKKHGWYDDVDKSVFSGADWLSHYDSASAGAATYAFDVAARGEFAFWIRCNYFRADMSYRVDGGPSRAIDLSSPRDTLMVSKKPDHRFIGWVKAGTVELSPGRHELEVTISSKLSNHGGVDCLCLTTERFVPSGTTRPGEIESRENGPDEWYPVIPDDDAFSPKSVIDMSHLLHRPAGKLGFLERDGAALKFKRGTAPVKFWGLGSNVSRSETPDQMTQRVRYLAKHGVNMVRQHSVFEFLGPLKGGEFDDERIDRLDRWFATLAEHGIYSTWSVFYPLRISADDGYPPELFAELDDGKTYGLVNMSRKLQDLQIAYVEKLLAHRNPYTRKRYRDDPALAVLEVHNEDCIFFHAPLNTLAAGNQWPRHSELLREMFCEWARKRYRTDTALRAAWGTDESLASGELRLYGAWQLDGKEKHPRKGDFIAFLTEMQRGYYERREKEVRRAGFKGVTVTTAWRAGGAGADPANLYCDTAMDMIDRHNYYGGGAGRHGIAEGDVNAGTHLARAGSGILSSGFYQVEDRPFCMTEWTQSPPNEWKAEIAPLVAFYGLGLQGWDASYHFLNSRTRLGDGWPGLSSYSSDTPHYMGQFPALAFAIQKGHIKEAPLAAARRLRREDLFLGVDPLGQDFTGGGWDAKSLQGNLATPADVFAIGRVTVSFDGGRSERADWSAYRDEERGVVRSMTGELEWDTKHRRVLVRSAKTQGIIGFAEGATIELPSVRVDVATPFVSLIFTPLDDEPLERSTRVLITALARDKQTGTEYAEDGRRLASIGGPPLLLEPVRATIRLSGEAPREVRALDVYGVPTGKTAAVRDGAFAIDGTFSAYYYEVVR